MIIRLLLVLMLAAIDARADSALSLLPAKGEPSARAAKQRKIGAAMITVGVLSVLAGGALMVEYYSGRELGCRGATPADGAGKCVGIMVANDLLYFGGAGLIGAGIYEVRESRIELGDPRSGHVALTPRGLVF